MSLIASGWDCFNAMNAQSPIPQGGRVFSMASMPFLYQNAYYNYHGATRGEQTHKLLIDVLKWLAGGRTNVVVATSPDAIDYDWYADGGNELIVGTYARAAIQNAGFTLVEYGPEKTADNMFNGVDIVIFDEWFNNYDTGSPAGQIGTAQSSFIWDYVMTQDKAILYMTNGSSTSGFGINASYAWGVGFFTLQDYAGSESIFDRAFSSGQTFGVKQWGGRMSVNAGIVNTPAYGLTYPSTKLAGWRKAESLYYHSFAAFSDHEDIGSFGQSWGS